MKLQTSIQPRRDGTVRAAGQDSQTYVFVPGPDGELTCDVTDDATVAQLLSTGNFWPADPEDFDTALSLAKSDEEEDEKEADDEEDEVPEGSLPVEAETPPAPKRAGKAKAK